MTEYETSKGKYSALARSENGFYREQSILNYTSITIVMIDNENNRTILPPIRDAGSVRVPCVCITERGGTSPSLDQNGRDTPMDGFAVKVRQSTIELNPVYLKEFDIVLSTEVHAITVKHPNLQVGYREGLEAAIASVGNTIRDAPCVKVIANDPAGHLDRLFTCIGDKPSIVPVTQMNDTEPTVTILYVRNGTVTKDTRSIDKLTSGTTNILEFTNCVIPWITTSEANATTRAQSFCWVSPEEVTNIRTSMSATMKQAVDQANAAASTRINELTTRVSTLTNELSMAQAERDDYKFKYNGLRADRQTSVDQMNAQYAVWRAQNDYNVSQ